MFSKSGWLLQHDTLLQILEDNDQRRGPAVLQRPVALAAAATSGPWGFTGQVLQLLKKHRQGKLQELEE